MGTKLKRQTSAILSSTVSDSIPSPPSLSGGLLDEFRLLEGKGKNLFLMLYLRVWNRLFPVSQLADVSIIYTLPRVMRKYYKDITITCAFMLFRLWYLSCGGTLTINTNNSTQLKNTHDYGTIQKLIKMGYIRRTTFDPLFPYTTRTIQPVFISFTGAGVILVKEIFRRVNYLACVEIRDTIKKEVN